MVFFFNTVALGGMLVSYVKGVVGILILISSTCYVSENEICCDSLMITAWQINSNSLFTGTWMDVVPLAADVSDSSLMS